jgi:predicted MFS family arabinose efflux permease
MSRVLNVVAGVSFATSLFQRAVDPVILQIAIDFSVDPATAALLSTAFAIPYALLQPVLGGMADMLGKIRLMTACLIVLVMSALAGAVATDFPMLFAARAISGMSAGGVFPIARAIAGDLVPLGERQVAISRLLAITLAGGLLGASLGGVVGDLIGWRGVFFGAAGIGAAALVAIVIGLRGVETDAPARFDLTLLRANYLTIFRNPLAKICFSAVFLEGIFLFGLFPHLAALLYAEGETRASIAGIVIGGFGLGGVIYAFVLPWVLTRFGARRLMIAGGSLVAVALVLTALRMPWPVEFLVFVLIGCAFYLLHGSIQIFVTELAPVARGASTALHSAFFFMGQGIGPVFYGFGFALFRLAETLIASAAGMAFVGLWCAQMLQHPAPSSVQPRPR